VEHLGRGELGLQDRNIVATAGLSIRPGKAVRELAQPLAQKGIDLVSGKGIANLLEALWIGTTEDAIVEGLEGDPPLSQLARGIFMAVQAWP